MRSFTIIGSVRVLRRFLELLIQNFLQCVVSTAPYTGAHENLLDTVVDAIQGAVEMRLL